MTAFQTQRPTRSSISCNSYCHGWETWEIRASKRWWYEFSRGISTGFWWFHFFASESGFWIPSGITWKLLHWRSRKTQVLITLGYLGAWGVCVVGEDDTLLDTYSPLPADSSDLHGSTGIELIALDLERMQLFDRTYLQQHSCHR